MGAMRMIVGEVRTMMGVVRMMMVGCSENNDG